jgi:hypothetical protein
MYKVLKCDGSNYQHCLSYSTEDTRLKTSPIVAVQYVEMGSRRHWHQKGRKTHENESLLLVTLHVLTWCVRNNNQSIQRVNISRTRVSCCCFIVFL